MSSRHLSAIAIGLALVVAPVGQTFVWAQTPAPTVVSLQATISAAARAAAAVPGFAALSSTEKLAAIQEGVAQALATSGASPEMIAAALIAAVKSGIISAGVAIAVAASVAPQFAQMVANDPAVVAQLAATGQSATVTGATSAGGSVSVLVSLQGAAGGGGGGPGVAPAAYDPCAGVIAAYCGS
jgi:hypothetical protein